MIENSRRWLRRNRSSFAFGAGILGVGYLASQYVAGKLSEARQRINDDRIAREKSYNPLALHDASLKILQSASPIRAEPRRL